MIAAPIHLAGERLMLDPAGAAYWPARKTLVVSDLHLEKGTSFANRGMLLPPWDTTETLARLARLVRHWTPETLILLGDSFHDATGSARVHGADADRLNAIGRATRIVWVLGNHDPAPPEFAGDVCAEHTDGPLTFRHIADTRAGPGELCGHHHPKAAIAARGANVSRPCFVTDGRRLMLPAFGTYTGGLDVRNPAIARHFPAGGRAFLLGRERLFSFALV